MSGTQPRQEAEDQAAVTKVHRVTVNLTEKSHEKLEETVKLTARNKTDTINRAIQVNAWLEEAIQNGASVFVKEAESGELQKIVLL
ncbi:hypothetical protein DFP74_4633 [Nocardiopsis sp. Huas11]|uniref:hypothetical protein n=1 Tax=Nocardiopsis sp. Huas11 TaxID=2183912 RepID=UPI000EB0DE03|nr:hypothetical protein [Nocardiopsis sp. Huas11]RKS08907.1 hypothetical protein DFP74_4633 [Nocardiopsis sp. Huas11]